MHILYFFENTSLVDLQKKEVPLFSEVQNDDLRRDVRQSNQLKKQPKKKIPAGNYFTSVKKRRRGRQFFSIIIFLNIQAGFFLLCNLYDTFIWALHTTNTNKVKLYYPTRLLNREIGKGKGSGSSGRSPVDFSV